jgi:hypothetical protein
MGIIALMKKVWPLILTQGLCGLFIFSMMELIGHLKLMVGNSGSGTEDNH